MHSIVEKAREIPIVEKVEVVVCGGGPAGLVAAIASARNGAKTLLVERYGFLGGMATAGLVTAFSTFTNGKEQIIKGIPHEILLRLKELNALRGNPEVNEWLFFIPEMLKYVALQLIEEENIKLLLHSYICGTYVDDNIIKGVIVENKSGRQAIIGNIIIDATGDGDVAASAGVPYKKGRECDGLMLPPSLVFRMGNINKEKYYAYVREKDQGSEGCGLPNIWRKGLESGELTVPLKGFLHCSSLPQDIEYSILATRVLKVDATNIFDLTRAEVEARKQALQVANFLKKYVPGFEKAYFCHTATQIGIRETRHIEGEYRLTAEDVLGAQKFSDAVARGCYQIDLHDPTGSRINLQKLPKGESYDIPYRCLIPKKIDNLLVAGRCISATHKAHGSIRVMSHCMAIGQAAGTAAALSHHEKISPRKLNVKLLQTQLKKDGVNLG